MAKRHLHIGGTAADLLLDGPLGVPLEHLIHDRGPAALAAALAGLDERSLSLDVNCFLLRGPRGIELVDAGAGGPSRGADLGLVYDDRPTDAADARRAVLARAAAEGWTVGGGHLRGFGRVALDGAGFRIDPLA